MKKLGHYFRLLLVLIGWTSLYLWVVNLVMIYFWHFNIFEKRYWLVINDFWNAGGVIDQFSEYMFLLMLILIIPLWILGFKKASHISYTRLIFFPIFWYNDYISKKYASAPEHIVLKNIGSSKINKKNPQQTMEEMIASRMPAATEKKDLNSSKIRQNFEKKNQRFHEKIENKKINEQK